MNDQILSILRGVDTPTVSNAIEIALGERQGNGFTRSPVTVADPELPPVVGYAATAVIRAVEPPSVSRDQVQANREAYYEYMASAPRPAVVVIEDRDWPHCVGAFWGEVNVAVHKGLGLEGAITNGVMRDLGMLDPGFQCIAGSVGPSHAFVRVEEMNQPVTVFDLEIQPGDLVHADRHGAVIIPDSIVDILPRAIDLVTQAEQPVLDAARSPDFSIEKLVQAWRILEKIRTQRED